MKLWILALVVVFPALSMERLSDWCERGGQQISVPPAAGQPPLLMNVMRNYPTCSVSVYITGSGGTLATIYSNNQGQALTNPFQADTFGSFGFYVSNGTYDIQISGGGLAAPYTFPARTAFDSTSFVPLVPFTNVTTGTSNGTLTVAGFLQTAPGAVINFGQSAHTIPWNTAPTSARPASCGTGEAFFATDAPPGQNLIICTSLNTWTALSGSGGGGDYFDWTRWTSGMAALPLHQLALNDSSFNNLLLVDETAGYPQANFNFTGYINATQQIKSSQGFLSSLYRNSNGQDYFDWVTTGLGQHAFDVRDSSNTPIVTYRNTSSTPGGGVFTFSGEVSTPPSSSVGFQGPIYRLNNGQDYFDWLNLTLGTHAFDIRDSFSFAIFQYRNNPFSASGSGTFTMNGNLVINGTCTGCGGGPGGGSVTGMAPIVATTTSGNTAISCPTCLPTTGGTMTGQLTLQSGCPVWCTGALYVPYGANIQMQVSPSTGQSSMCTPSSTAPPTSTCPDTTLIDYFGIEGVFFRMKGGGNYFDWTRWTAGTTPLPAGQLNLNNHNFQTLLNVNDTFGTGMTQFNFSGYINSTLQVASQQGMMAPIFKLNNGSDYFEWINATLGTNRFQIQDSSSMPILDFTRSPTGAWNSGMYTFNGNVTITGTCTGCSPAGSGVTVVTPTAPIVASITGATLSVSCPTCATTAGTTVTSITGTTSQILANNMTGTPVTGVITLTLPQNIDSGSVPRFTGLTMNQADDGGGYSLQIAPQAGGNGGGIEVIGQKTVFLNGCSVANCINVPAGGVTAGTAANGGFWIGTTQVVNNVGIFNGPAVSVSSSIITSITGTATAFQAGGGTFRVLGSGDIAVATNVNVAAGGTYKFNNSPAFRYNGTSGTGNVQFSNDGVNWTNIGGGGAAGVTSVTGGAGISAAPTTGAVIVTNTGVTSVTGTASQVITTGPTGNITLSLPQSIATTSAPTFGTLMLNTTNDNVYTLQVGGGMEVKGQFTLFFNGCTAGNCVNVPTGGVSASSFSIATGSTTFGTVISNANGGQFVGAGGINTNGTITSQNFVQSGTAGMFVGTNQAIDNGGGAPRFVGAGGVFTSGSIVANLAIGTNATFNQGSNVGTTRNIVIGGCTIFVAGGIIYNSSGC